MSEYYLIGEDLTQSTVFISELSAMVEESLLQASSEPTKTLTKTMKFLGKANVGSQIVVETYDIIVNGENNSVTVGGAVIDMTANAAGTLLATKLLIAAGLSGGVLAVGVVVSAAAVAGLYSAFVEGFVDDWWLTLNGKDEIKLFDSSDNQIAGLIYPDGFAGPATDAVYAFITHPNSQSIDFTGHKILVDNTVIGSDPDFTIVSADVLKDVAAQLGMTFEDFLVTSSGVHINDNNPLKVAA